MKLLQFSIINVQLSINDQYSMINEAATAVCELLNVNSMEIVNCEMKIAEGAQR